MQKQSLSLQYFFAGAGAVATGGRLPVGGFADGRAGKSADLKIITYHGLGRKYAGGAGFFSSTKSQKELSPVGVSAGFAVAAFGGLITALGAVTAETAAAALAFFCSSCSWISLMERGFWVLGV